MGIFIKLPSLRKIFSSDFKAEFKQLVDQLGILFNGGLEPLYDALNGKLTFRDNFAATVADFVVTVDETGKPRQTTTFKLTNNQAVIEGIFVIGASGANNTNIMPIAAPFISYTRNGPMVTVTNITGLIPQVSYRIKVIALG